MFRRLISCGGLLLLAGAVLFATPGSGWARGGFGGGHFGGAHFGGAHFGGAHFGGGHFGVARFGGYHGGFYHGGYHPYYGYRHSYHPYYGFYPNYSYGYYPYYDAYPYLRSGVATDPGYADDYADVGPSYLDDTTSAAPPAVAYQSYYPPATGSDQPQSIAKVTVNVPPDAKVWFEDKPMTSTGAVRQFDSPPLTPGTPYTYDIKARWNENGHEVTQEQRVEVTAGAHVNVRFPAPPKATGQASAATHG
jgi:uncharacterized protein (TIGR03000 family)